MIFALLLELKKFTSAIVSATCLEELYDLSLRTMVQIKLNSKDFITSFFSTIISARVLNTFEES